MSKLIATDSPFSAGQLAALPLLLDLIIPEEPERGLPSAADVGFVEFLTDYAPDSVQGIRAELDELQLAAVQQHNCAFEGLAKGEREALVNQLRQANPAFAQTLANRLMHCYYQDESVMRSLGLAPRAPFPEGHEVEPGDLTLLEPVRLRGRLYREA